MMMDPVFTDEVGLAAAVGRMADALLQTGTAGRKARATAAEIAERRKVVATILERAWSAGDGPLTSRGVAYRLVGLGMPKTASAFRHVEEAVLWLRDAGVVPWKMVADGARSVIPTNRFTDVDEALRILAAQYRRDLWAEAPVQVQVWIEKAGLASTLAEFAGNLGVHLFPARGFSGAGFIHDAIVRATHDERPLVLLLAGDLDASGQRALEAIERRARRGALEEGVQIETVERWAVTAEQVQRLDLPTRPQAQTTHRRADDEVWAVELDAMEPADLRAALEDAVNRWCPPALRAAAREVEEADRARLASLIA